MSILVIFPSSTVVINLFSQTIERNVELTFFHFEGIYILKLIKGQLLEPSVALIVSFLYSSHYTTDSVSSDP